MGTEPVPAGVLKDKMFDFLRDFTKSAEEKERETLNAYLDGELSERARERFEQRLADDPALQTQLDDLRQIKLSIQRLPRVRAPRNFTLDPAVYGRPVPQRGFQLYPVLRTATVLAAFFFILTLALDLYLPDSGLLQTGGEVAMVEESAADVAVESVEEDSVDVSNQFEITREVTGEAGETVVEELAVEEEAEEVAPPAIMAEEAVEEEAAEEEAPAELADEAQPDADLGAAAAVTEEEMSEEPATAEAAAEMQAPRPEAEEPGTGTARALPTIEPGEEGAFSDEVASQPVEEAVPAAGEAEQAVEQVTGAPTPWLLVIEVALGLSLVVLLVALLWLRRRRVL